MKQPEGVFFIPKNKIILDEVSRVGVEQRMSLRPYAGVLSNLINRTEIGSYYE